MMFKNDLLRVIFTASLVASIVLIKTAFAADSIFMEAEVVEFESASYTYTPSPFKVRLAEKQGVPVEIKTEPSVSLTGYLAKPAGEEPRAAIVLLHTCAGLSKHEEMWSKRLVSWGYVVLSVDSFSPRGLFILTPRSGLHLRWPGGSLRRAMGPGPGCLRRKTIFVDSFIRRPCPHRGNWNVAWGQYGSRDYQTAHFRGPGDETVSSRDSILSTLR